MVIIWIASCTSKKQEASFYYWKTNFKLSETESQTLNETNTSSIYIRFFDVDKKNDSIVPLGLVSGLKNIPDSLQIIPTIFITNRTLLGATKKDVCVLAQNLSSKINKMATINNINFNEFQIDCDWSEKTKTVYFDLLQQLQAQTSDKTLSVTIRLHQIKYPLRSGIPPVKKGVLMFYNMGKLNDTQSKNSIYNAEDASKYISYIKAYPIQLDYALPIFSWQVHKRNDKVIGLVSKDEIPDTTNNEILLKLNPGTFKIKSPFLHKGRYFMQGDELQTEQINKATLVEAAKLLSENIDKTKPHKIIFFDLDETHFKHITHETIKEVLDILN
ncbi:MAG: hypothetical protein Q8M29_05715 [Bacteroidota bacterium]|nr:hypothetical protein [Bacteroidota bacterium]